MRTINFLWFWHICWNNDKPWTLLFSLMIPLVPMGIIMEIYRYVNSSKLSYFSVICCLALTAWTNEIILKPALYVPPLDDCCSAGIHAPATFVAIGCAAIVVYASRLIFYAPRDLFALISWSIATILSFIAHPLVNYLSWTYDAISIVPGVVIGLLWALIFETKFFSQTLFQLCGVFKLENDITGESFKKEEDLIPA